MATTGMIGSTQPLDVSYVPMNPATMTQPTQEVAATAPSGRVGDMATQTGLQINVNDAGFQFATRTSRTAHTGQTSLGNSQ